MTKWEIVRIQLGKQQSYLDEGWEPFAVAVNTESYHHTDNITHNRLMEIRSFEYIYFRKAVESNER